MIKKILLSILLILCVSCSSQETSPDKKEYIDPVKDVLLFDEVDQKLQDRLKAANNDAYYQNYQFQMLFKDIYEDTLTDINGNPFRFKEHEKVWLEIVSVNCGHCQDQLTYVKDLLAYEDVTFVQYFNVGHEEEVRELYASQDLEIPEDLTVITLDPAFRSYIANYLKVKLYPSLIGIMDREVSFINAGEIAMEDLPKIYDICFVDRIKKEELTDRKGRDLLSLNHSIDDVRASLNPENLESLRELDNDDHTEELTLSIIGSSIDYKEKNARGSSAYINEVNDFTYYQDKKTVFLYTYLRDNSETDKVEFINELIRSDENYQYVVVLMEGMESSSAALRNMKVSFTAPVVSSLAAIPGDLLKFGLINYPTAVFVDEGTFTGVYSNIADVESFKKALGLFLSDDCIAYKKNN